MNEPDIKVSIIVPVYNSEKYIGECIDSIVKQSYENIELVLVDDGSRDSSGLICDKYALIDERIKVIHNTNHGVSHARNCGIEIASGEYLCFIDSDDYVDLDFIYKLVIPTKDKQYDFVVCRHFSVNKGKIRENICDLKICSENIKQDYWLLTSFVGGPVMKLYKSSIIEQYNLRFNEALSYSEDRVFNSIFYTYVKKYFFVNEALYYTVNRNPNSLSKASSLKVFKDALLELRITSELLTKNNYYNSKKIIFEHTYNIIMRFACCRNSDFGYREYRKELETIENLIEQIEDLQSLKQKIACWLLKKKYYWAIWIYKYLKNKL